jgi:hypothetical protein
MASITGITITTDKLTAKAERGVNGTAWLSLRYGTSTLDRITVGVDFDLAQLYANAINGANTEYQDQLDEDAAAARCRKMDYQVEMMRAAE